MKNRIVDGWKVVDMVWPKKKNIIVGGWLRKRLWRGFDKGILDTWLTEMFEQFC